MVVARQPPADAEVVNGWHSRPAGSGLTSVRAWASSAGVVTGGRSRRGRWNSASQATESMAVGTPARTWRGLRGWPSAIGAGGSEVLSSPAQ